MAPKRELFAALDGMCAPGAILATNTSAISVTAIAAASAYPERCLGLHFFNPAPLMPLVEVVRAELTAEAPYAAACELVRACGKQAVRCSDTPGFVVNRLLIPALNDAVRALDEIGIEPAEVDLAMTAGAGWPIGPFRLIDLIGVDVHVHAAEALHAAVRRSAHGASAAPASHGGRRLARPQERPRVLRLRCGRMSRHGCERSRTYEILTAAAPHHDSPRWIIGVCASPALSACPRPPGLLCGPRSARCSRRSRARACRCGERARPRAIVACSSPRASAARSSPAAAASRYGVVFSGASLVVTDYSATHDMKVDAPVVPTTNADGSRTYVPAGGTTRMAFRISGTLYRVT